VRFSQGFSRSCFHAERDAAVSGVDAEDDGLDFVAGLDQLGRMLEALGPGHLREVDQAFNALLQLKRTRRSR